MYMGQHHFCNRGFNNLSPLSHMYVSLLPLFFCVKLCYSVERKNEIIILIYEKKRGGGETNIGETRESSKSRITEVLF